MPIPGVRVLDEILAGLPENARLRAQLSDLRAEMTTLQKENDELKQMVEVQKSTLQQLHEKNKKLVRAPDRRDEVEERLLQLLWSHSRLTVPQIAPALGVDVERIKFHLEELEAVSFVHAALFIGAPAEWSLGQGGRKYVLEKKLDKKGS